MAAEFVFWGALLGLAYPYLGYPALLMMLQPLARGRQDRGEAGHRPGVSLIIAAHNEQAHIAARIQNLLDQDYPQDRIEVLVGSDGSDDDTAGIVGQFEDSGVRLLDFQKRRGKMAVVNDLVAAATHDVCVFSDASEMFDATATALLAGHFHDPGVGAVTGNHRYNASATPLSRGTAVYWRFQRFLQKLESSLHSVTQCDGTIYACRREAFPYPPSDTINDDVAVPLGVLRRGLRVIYEPRAVARGDMLATTGRFLRQKIRGQAGRYQTIARNLDLLASGPPARWWIFISHFIFPILAPWFLVTMLVVNVLLVGRSPLYDLLLAGQLVFYALALAGFWAQRVGRSLALLSVPFYFVAANVGSLAGFWGYLSQTQRAAWKRVD